MINQSKSNDIEGEFYKRFLSLFASYYDVPSTDPIISFPAPPIQNKDDTQNKPKSSLSQPLTSGVWDVRLKRAVEKYQNEIEESNNNINQKINENVKKLTDQSEQHESLEELTDIFLPEKASRPEVPKYVQCFETEKKKEIEEQKNMQRSCKIDNTLAIRQFNIRLKKQKQRSIEWKRKLKEKQLDDERKHQEFLATLPKTERSGDKALTMTTKQVIKEQKQFAKTLYAKRIEEGNKITKSNFDQYMPQRPSLNNPEIEEEEEDN